MPSADEYRCHAAECLALAQRLTDPDDKAKMLEMAEAWRRLAEWAASRERTKESDKP